MMYVFPIAGPRFVPQQTELPPHPVQPVPEDAKAQQEQYFKGQRAIISSHCLYLTVYEEFHVQVN